MLKPSLGDTWPLCPLTSFLSHYVPQKKHGAPTLHVTYEDTVIFYRLYTVPPVSEVSILLRNTETEKSQAIKKKKKLAFKEKKRHVKSVLSIHKETRVGKDQDYQQKTLAHFTASQKVLVAFFKHYYTDSIFISFSHLKSFHIHHMKQGFYGIKLFYTRNSEKDARESSLNVTLMPTNSSL